MLSKLIMYLVLVAVNGARAVFFLLALVGEPSLGYALGATINLVACACCLTGAAQSFKELFVTVPIDRKGPQ